MTSLAYPHTPLNRTKTMRYYPFVFLPERMRTACDRSGANGNGASSRGTRRTDNARGQLENRRFLCWTEDVAAQSERRASLLAFPSQSCVGAANRLYTVADERHYSYYAYDYNGERTLKMSGDAWDVDQNAWEQHIFSCLNNVTLYPSPYLVLSNHGYTKHYYAGTERVAARLGSGGLSHDTSCIIRNDQIVRRTDHLFWHIWERINKYEYRKPERLDIVRIDGEILDEAYKFNRDKIPLHLHAEIKIEPWKIHKIIENLSWPSHPSAPSYPPEEPEVFFYHSDHLGGASWITDGDGNPVQHLQYLPFGQPFVDQHSAGYQERFTFTGKERDEETGYGYFGARYMDHELMTMWLSVDPMADKYPGISPYAYCAWNPEKLVDPDGRDIWILTDKYNSNAPRVKWTENGVFNEDGSRYEGSDDFVLQTSQALNAIYGDNQMLLSQFMGESEYDISISETYGNTEYNKSVGGTEKYGYSLQKEQPIVFNPTMGLAQCKGDAENEEYLAPFLCLLHEFGHAYNAVTDHKGFCDRVDAKTGDAYSNKEEQFVIQNYEQPAAAKHGMLQRTSHILNYDGLRIIQTEGPLSSKPIKK